MTRDDIAAFFTRRDALDAEAYLELDYTFECVGDPRAAAAQMCIRDSPGGRRAFPGRLGGR